MRLYPPPGLQLDTTPVAPTPVWNIGFNIRFRLEQAETIGLFGPLKDAANGQIILPADPNGDPYRTVYSTPNTTTGQILAASANRVQLIDYDPASTPATGTRWRQTELTPAGLANASDIIPNPSAARVEIPPAWWFADQDDLVVGSRANVTGDPAYVWDRNRGNDFVPLANSPTGAVGGGILDRILVLIGCTSFSDPDPRRFMTVRWSDRFNFENWTPTDTNISGELQLEGGSRIVGGGITGFGVAAWTDRRFAIFDETFDPDSVFSRRYVDGGRGLLANRSWCEADGRIWWYDESRVLNVFDGGRPRQIPNPLKYATIERLEDGQTARAYLVPNPEFGEIILHYPDQDGANPDTQLVYNYLMDVWYIWRLSRTAWGPRFGVINTLGISPDGAVWRHDLDISLPDPYINGPGNPNPLPFGNIIPPRDPRIIPDASDVAAFDFALLTNLVTMEDVTSETWRMTRILADHLPSPSVGAESDTFDVVLTGYGRAETLSPIEQDWQTFQQGGNAKDFRVGGKAMQVGIYASQIKTLFRFGGFDVSAGEGGER